MVSQWMSFMMVNSSKWSLDQRYWDPSDRFAELWSLGRRRLSDFLPCLILLPRFLVFLYPVYIGPSSSDSWILITRHSVVMLYWEFFFFAQSVYLNLCKLRASQRSLKIKDLFQYDHLFLLMYRSGWSLYQTEQWTSLHLMKQEERKTFVLPWS